MVASRAEKLAVLTAEHWVVRLVAMMALQMVAYLVVWSVEYLVGPMVVATAGV